MKITILDGTQAFDPTKYDTDQPCGGIVTSLTLLPRMWVGAGHEVHVASLAPSQVRNGVEYHTNVDGLGDSDIVIFNRNCISRAALNYFKRAYKISWLHDIVDHRYFEDDSIKHVDKIVALSEYCAASYSDFYGVSRERFVTIPNGVDADIWYDTGGPRDPNLYITASSPIKGFGPIAYTWHNLRRVNPNATLRMYCSQSLHGLPDDSFAKSLGFLRDNGIDVREPIGQRELASVFRNAWVLLMPNTYPEICSNVLLQARACGLPVIASGIGSAPEFLPPSCYTKTSDGNDKFWFWKEFTEKALRLYVDTYKHATLSRTLPDGVWTWEQVSEEWEQIFSRSTR